MDDVVTTQQNSAAIEISEPDSIICTEPLTQSSGEMTVKVCTLGDGLLERPCSVSDSAQCIKMVSFIERLDIAFISSCTIQFPYRCVNPK
jgi:hypothetical protein